MSTCIRWANCRKNFQKVTRLQSLIIFFPPCMDRQVAALTPLHCSKRGVGVTHWWPHALAKDMEIFNTYNTNKGTLFPNDIYFARIVRVYWPILSLTPFCDQFKGPSKHMFFVIISFISCASLFSHAHKNTFMFSTRETITEADAMAPVHSPGSLMCINRRIISLKMWNVYHHTDAPRSLSPRCNLSGSKTSLLEGKKPLTRLLSVYRL